MEHFANYQPIQEYPLHRVSFISSAGCGLWHDLLDCLGISLVLISEGWIEQVPQRRLGVPTWCPPNKCQDDIKHQKVELTKNENVAKKEGNTKLSIDYGHVWNSLVTIVISLTVELFGADINCRFLQSRFSTYICVDLLQEKFEHQFQDAEKRLIM